MAITNIKEGAFLGGNFDSKKYAVTVEFQVFTDSHLDGPDTIRRNSFFRLGKTYSFGNDRNPSARLKSVNVKSNRRLKFSSSETVCLWRVECSFDTETVTMLPPEEGGEPTSNPGGDDPPEGGDDGGDVRDAYYVQILYQTKREIINRARWLQTWEQPDVGKAKPTANSFSRYHGGKYIGPVCSSAFVPKVPAPEREVAYPVIRLGGTILKGFLSDLDHFEQIASMPGKINNKKFTVKGPPDGMDTFKKTFPKHVLKIGNVSIGKLEQHGDLLVSCEVELIVDYDKHTIMDLDEGFSVLAEKTSFNDRVNNRNPETEILRDERGAPLQNPVLLNGLGEVLPKGTSVTDARNKTTVFYNEFIDHKAEADFDKMDLLDGMLFR